MISIRKAKKDDLENVARIFREETSKKPYNKKWTEKEAFDMIKKLFKEEEINLALIDKEIVGFSISHIKSNKKEAYVDELWLKSRYQGKGIGKILMKFIENKYEKKGVKELGLTVNQKAGAVYFYNKLGYKKKYAFFHMEKKLR